MPRLIVRCDETSLSQRFDVHEDRFTIGRSPESTISIKDMSVSKVHLVILKTPTGYTFQDLWSQNGTLLNDVRCREGSLKDGDVLCLGKVKIAFQVDQIPSPGPSPEPSPQSSQQSSTQPSTQPGATLRPHGRRWRLPDSISPGLTRVMIVLGVGALGITLGILAGGLGSHFSSPRAEENQSREIASENKSPRAATRDDPGNTGHAGDRAFKAALSKFRGNGAGLTDEQEAEISRESRGTAEELLSDLERPYADRGESMRVLFRLALDLLERPPTRAEVLELSSLSHRERWATLNRLRPADVPEGTVASYQRYLDRVPTVAEWRVFEVEENVARKLEVGLVLTASREYRDPRYRRPRSPRQMAFSLVVDLLDRPPDTTELRDVEEALEFDPHGTTARALAHSAPLPQFREGGEDPTAREWATREIQRFLLRAPTEEEVRAVEAEVVRGQEGARWVRIALSSLPDYRSY